MIVLLWILNAAISWMNAWGCGKTWTETRANGGFPHFMNWCGAVMAAVGFTWCYMVLLGLFGATVPFEHEVAGKVVSAPYLSQHGLQVFAELGYLVIIGPLLGSGIAITLHSWGVMWRRRTFGDTAVSAWNTFAMGKNVYDAAVFVPKASKDVWSFFSGGSDSKEKNIILWLVVFAVVGGALTTAMIIRSVARDTARQRRLDLEMART